jgi:hypothetical protein
MDTGSKYSSRLFIPSVLTAHPFRNTDTSADQYKFYLKFLSGRFIIIIIIIVIGK